VCVYACMCVCVYVCVCVRARVCARMHAYQRTCVHACHSQNDLNLGLDDEGVSHCKAI